MRLSTVRPEDGDGATTAALQDGDEFVLLPYSDVGALLATGEDWQERAARSGDRVPLDRVTLAPVVPHPNKIVCLGLNYATHIKEMGRPTPTHPPCSPSTTAP
ncbi:hypothetical protein [Streptomyces sp. NPDC001381]|uniref:hypothetical protein n=1 Tax=Streptomyces sp. NPDC001381 TaxID=3364567 RepID=UPI003687F470